MVTDKGYIRVYIPKPMRQGALWKHTCDKQGRAYEHRLIVSRAMGTPLHREHVVHHVNGIRHDNRLDNLWVFDSTKLHSIYEETGWDDSIMDAEYTRGIVFITHKGE